jgi:predicted TIM-barrel fold metal-dependent hydrolase
MTTQTNRSASSTTAQATSRVAALIDRGASLAALGWRIIDAHNHLGPTQVFYIPQPEAASMVALMDRVGVNQAGLASHLAVGPDYVRGNDLTAAAVHAFPERFFGYAVPNPRYPDDVRAELQRSFDTLGLCAIKLHPTMHNYSVLEPACEEIWRFAEERSTFCLIHTWEGDARCSPSAVGQVARAHPTVPFLLGHSGGTPAGRREAIAVAHERPNVYLELCGSLLARAEVAWMVQEVGAERVLFGTDTPWLDPRIVLGKVALSGLNEEQLRLVLGENILRLLEP